MKSLWASLPTRIANGPPPHARNFDFFPSSAAQNATFHHAAAPPTTTKIVSYLTGVGALAEQDDPGLHHLGRISMFPLFGKTMRGYGRRAPPPPPI